MRYLNAFIIAMGLSLVPSISQATPGAQKASPSASVAEPARATQSNRAERVSVGSSSRAADTAADQERYAEREAQSGEAQEYRGGDTVVIGSSVLVVVLVVLLVVVLL